MSVTLTTVNLREVNDGCRGLIRNSPRSPLVLVKSNGEIRYANNRGDKDALVECCDFSADVLLWSWTGEWKTDVFRLSKDDIQNYYKVKP